MNNPSKHFTRKFSLVLIFALLSIAVRAAGPPVSSSMSNPFVVIMVIIIMILALAIGLLANVVLGAAFAKRDTEKIEAGKSGDDGKPASQNTSLPAAIVFGLLFAGIPSMAQNKPGEAATTAGNLISGISSTAFYAISGVIFLELLVILVLLYNLKSLLSAQRLAKQAEPVRQEAKEFKPRINWWERFNKFRPVEEEVKIDLGHDYDGIRELDNRLPPWWLYGFYCTILFAGIYLWRYHVSHSAPLSGQEFEIAMKQASVQREEYLKRAANNIDESNVKLLTGEKELSGGKAIFETVCATCHGKSGEGIVGPNLTDDYWIHGGSINEIFKTIKYGWPEKGMKSWKDDYSPSQIAGLASYIKSLHGTHPANPKAPQGTIYSDQSSSSPSMPDSTGTVSESTKKTAIQ